MKHIKEKTINRKGVSGQFNFFFQSQSAQIDLEKQNP